MFEYERERPASRRRLQARSQPAQPLRGHAPAVGRGRALPDPRRAGRRPRLRQVDGQPVAAAAPGPRAGPVRPGQAEGHPGHDRSRGPGRVRAGHGAPVLWAGRRPRPVPSRRARLGGTRATQRPGPGGGEVPWHLPQRTPRRLPLAGAIPAGPVKGFVPDEGMLEIDGELAGPGRYALRARGDSLVELGVFDGDVAIVDPEQPAHHWHLVAGLLPSEDGDEDLATLKVFELRQDQAWLVSANPVYPPIPIEQTWVLGRVTTIIRRL